jgi:Protein of unknown function (DUF4230)
MFKSKIILTLGILLLIAVYFLGKKNGSNKVTQTVINNIDLIKEIAELSSLSVTGSTTVKLSNNNDSNGWLDKVKNYLTENTLQVTIPYGAKYGVDLDNKTVRSNIANNKITILFPPCKLLSLQLQLDKLQTMNQTGLFNSTTISDLANAQKQLYQQTMQKLENDSSFLHKSQNQIKTILIKYYKPLGISVDCTFEP